MTGKRYRVTGDSNAPFHLSVYDKRDDFSFRIVNFSYIDSNIPANPAYGVYISQLVSGYARICTPKLDFIHRLRRLSTRLLHQGFKSTLLSKSLSKLFKRHDAIIEKYGITPREMRLTIQDWETRRILCYFISCVSPYRPFLASIFNMVHARAQFSSSFARALLI